MCGENASGRMEWDMDTGGILYAVIGRSEGAPTLYHMNQKKVNAERLQQRRERASGEPCFVVPMAQWHANPRTALQQAEAARFG